MCLDDYRYLVFDFGGREKRKKSVRREEREVLSNRKLYTQQSTPNNQKIKLSSSSAAMTYVCGEYERIKRNK